MARVTAAMLEIKVLLLWEEVRLFVLSTKLLRKLQRGESIDS